MLLFKQTMAILLMVISSNLVLSKPAVDYCSSCQSFSEFINDMQMNQTESVVNMNLYKMCLKENEGSNSRVCVFLTSTMQNTLKHIGQEDFCTKINACPSNRPVEKALSVNKERCEFCTDLIDSFKSLLADNNVDLLRQSLNNYCKMTGDFEEECLKNLNKNLVQLVDFVQNKMDSEMFCNAIKSCHHQTIEEINKPSIGDLVSLRDPVQMASHLEFLEQQKSSQAFVDPHHTMGNPLTCMVCRQVVVIIYSQLHKNATRENVEHLLAKACYTLHPKDKARQHDCEEKVVKNTDIILQSFINHIPPDLVCLLTGMCIPGEQLKPVKEVARIEDIDIETKSIRSSIRNAVNWAQNYKCYFCEKIVDFLFKELDEKKTREYIKHLLEKSCETLFKKEERQDKCDEYVDAYTDKLIDLIEKAKNPGLICNALHACPAKFSIVQKWDEKKLTKMIEPFTNKQSDFVKDGPVVKVDWCNICQKTYPILTEVVQIDEAKDRVKGLAHNFCDRQILPINQTQCKAKADAYLDIIVHVRDSKEGCQKLTLCPANTDAVSFEFDLQVIDLGSVDTSNGNVGNLGWWEDAKCSGCKLLVKAVYTNLNKTINSPATRDFISRTCEHIHQDELKEKCKEDAHLALETLLKDFEENLPPQQACELMEYCHKKDGFDYSASLKPLAQSGVCNGCKSIFPILHRILQNPNIKEAVLNVTEKVCEHSENPEECKKKTSDLINNLADEETAEAACSGLCENDLMTTLGFKLSECTRCQASMLAIDHLFNSEFIKHRLNSSLENFCDSRNDETATKCKHLVRAHLPKFYELVHNITDHDTGFCMTMGYCEKRNAQVNALFGLNDADNLLEGADELIPDEDEFFNDPTFWTKSSTSDTGVCKGCKDLFKNINERIINRSGTKDQLLKALLRTCPKRDDKCREFYKKYINYFYDQLVRDTDPDRACPYLKLCPNNGKFDSENDEEFKPAFELGESTVCKECESAITYLVSTLNNKTVVDFIMKELQQKICNPLNFIERKACNRLIKQFGPKLMQRFVNKINKDRICNRQLKLCKDDDHINIGFSNFDFVPLFGDAKCLTCQNAVAKLNDLRGESSRRFSVEEICGDDSECSDFMFNFLDFFSDENVNSDPYIACSELDICQLPSRVQLLGGLEKCRFGPQYWCLSAAHAEACNTTDYCQKNYWQSVAN